MKLYRVYVPNSDGVFYQSLELESAKHTLSLKVGRVATYSVFDSWFDGTVVRFGPSVVFEVVGKDSDHGFILDFVTSVLAVLGKDSILTTAQDVEGWEVGGDRVINLVSEEKYPKSLDK